MADLVIIVPTRGRPAAAAALAQAFKKTCTADTHLLFAVDDDDPELAEYRRVQPPHTTSNPEHSMVACLNRAARDVLAYPPFAIGFMGDDHCPRTAGWDAAYLEALRDLGTGIVYGNDLLQGANLPTQVAMTADIVRALGWMAPPALRHLYVDNFWRDLGNTAGCLRYLPDVVVEHRHPVAGKAQWDAGYARVNDGAVYAHDEAAYLEFAGRGGLEAATAAVRALCGAA